MAYPISFYGHVSGAAPASCALPACAFATTQLLAGAAAVLHV